jgi:hypothetical protein
MNIFGDQITFLENVEKHLFKELEINVNQFSHVLKDFLVGGQLFDHGMDGNNQKLPGYSRYTIKMKIRKGDPYDRTTLKDEGKFHESIDVTGTPYYIVISSNDPKAKHLVKRYGEDILKISIQHFSIFFNEFFIPNLKKYVNHKIVPLSLEPRWKSDPPSPRSERR